MFEKAKWITKEYTMEERPAPLLRKTFDIDKAIKSAVLNACGLGYGVYFINGKKVTEDVLITPVTKYDARLLYSTYDVSDLVKTGANVVGSILGNGWYNDLAGAWNYEKSSWRDCPKLILQIDIVYEDGSKQTIISDSSWKVFDSPILVNHSRSGEVYDARCEIEGWCSSNFDDGIWGNAIVCRGAGGTFSQTKMPPIRIAKTLKATRISEHVFDLGQNISGWAKIKVQGTAGTKISMLYAECLNEDGTINNVEMNKFNREMMPHGDKYILKGIGIEEYEPSFAYHGFRYIHVDNIPEYFEIEGRVVHTDLDIIGNFECSDQMLNKIHSATRWSTLTNYHGFPTDCPQREQNGWTGDALVSAEQSIMNYDMLEAYRKWLDDFKDVQRPNGQIPGIVPTSNWGYNWGSGPAWDSFLILVPYYVFNITGDKSLIEQMWDNMVLYMEFMDSMAEDYIVNYGLGDWCPPKTSKVCETVVTDTAYYYKNAQTMAICAELIGKDGSKYIELAKNIKKAFRDRFIKAGIVLGDNQTSIACGIYQGLYNEDEVPNAAKRLAELVREKDYHIDCGILGTKYIFSALSDNGYADLAYKMVVNPTMPSYAYWMNSGLTTLSEDWEMTMSLNHHMFSEVDMWFYKHLAGITFVDNKLIIKPCFIQELDFVRAHHRDIKVYWDKEKISVEVPCKATLVLNEEIKELVPGSYTFIR